MQMTASDFFAPGRRLRPAVGSDLLPALLQYTNLRSFLGMEELVHAVVRSGSVEALRLLRAEELEYVVHALRSGRRTNADFLAAAVQYLRAVSSDSSISLSFTADPLSERSVRQHWEFASDGADGVRLLRYLGTETDILIPHRVGERSVTQIDPRAFRVSRRLTSAQRVAMRNIARVEFPGSIETIPAGLFDDCAKTLAGVVLQDGTMRIDEAAFSGCALHRIQLPDSIAEVGARAFEDCTRLTDAELPPRLRVLDDETFQGCLALTAVPDLSCTQQVGARAFRGSGVRRVHLPANGPWLDKFVFADCENLTAVTMEEGTDCVPWGAFADCHQLKDLRFASSVRVIDRDAFARCRSLAEAHLPSGLTHIAKHAFQECWALEEISVPDTVRSVGEGAFEGCASLVRAALRSAARLRPGIFASCRQLTDVELPQKLTEIPDEMFLHCTSLSVWDLPEDVRRIGERAYSDTALRQIHISGQVTEIDRGAFCECQMLRSAAIAGDPQLQPAIFADCRQLAAADLPDVQEIPLEMFRSCSSLRQFSFPDGLLSVGPGAFRGSALEEVYLPGSLREIGEGAFADCKYLQKVSFAAQTALSRIASRAFSGAAALRTMQIPEGVREIRDSAFCGSGIERIEIPATVQKIHPRAFADCVSLREVVFEDANRSDPPLEIDAYAFSGCSALHSIHLPERIWSIGKSAFENTGLRSVRIPKGLHEMGEGAFRGAQEMRRAQIEAGGPGVVSDGVFQDCTGLSEIVFDGPVSRIGAGAFRRTGLRELEIPDSVQQIGRSAFRGCNALQRVRFGTAAPQMDGDIFRECHHLREIDLPADLTAVPPRMFRNCTRLSEAAFPPTLQAVKVRAFQGTGLVAADLPDSVRSIEAGAFFGCRHLESVHVPEGAEIGAGAFLRCPMLADEDGTVLVSSIVFGNGNESRYASFDSRQMVRAPQEKIRCADELEPLILPSETVALDPLLVLPEIVYVKPSRHKTRPRLGEYMLPGDIVQFGCFPQTWDFQMEPVEWAVLESEEEDAVLAARRALLFVRSADQPGRADELLRTGFLFSAFTMRERRRLLPVPGEQGDLTASMGARDLRKYELSAEPTPYAQRLWDMYHAGRGANADIGTYVVPVIRVRQPLPD